MDLENNTAREEIDMIYDYKTPPKWYLNILLGIQHFLSMCTPNAVAVILVMKYLCLEDNPSIQSQLISTSFFVMGISTVLQTICGCKLPIIHGASIVFLIPCIRMMSMPEISSCNISDNKFAQNMFTNTTLPESVFQMKIRLISGAFMISSFTEIIIPITGILGYLKRLISPLTLAAIFMVLSLAISRNLMYMVSEQWIISTIAMIITMTLCVILAPLRVPIPVWSIGKKWRLKKMKIFEFSPIIIALILSWIICAICTVSGIFSEDSKGFGYLARTDTKLKAIYDTPIFQIPYPFKWGFPMIIPSMSIGLTVGVIVSAIESVGDYMITADICKAPKIPDFAINRGILVEGFGVLLSGLFGLVVAPTSYSGNIAVLKITKSGNVSISRITGLVMIICGLFPIVGFFFVSIPGPVIGGITFIITAMLMSFTLTNLQYVNVHSSRNIIIFGLSVAFGLHLPQWSDENQELLRTGNHTVNAVIQILLSINIFITAILSIFLDNILPGKSTGEKKIRSSKVGSINSLEEFRNKELKAYRAFDFYIFEKMALKFKKLQYLPLFPAYRKVESKGDKKDFEISKI